MNLGNLLLGFAAASSAGNWNFNLGSVNAGFPSFSYGKGKGNHYFPTNTEGIPAWVSITFIERVAGSMDTVLSGATPKGDPIGSVYLYMPQSISMADGLTYDNAELTGLTSAVMASANEGKDEGAGAALSSLSESAKNLFTQYAQTKTSAGSLLAAQRGQAINPRAAMLFKSPTFRQLALNWKMIPSNKNDARAAKYIINACREHAYPELINNGASFQYPDLFRIEFIGMGHAKPQVIPFADAYCTGVTANYNPTSPGFMKDGYPNEIDFTLNFQETRVLDRKAISQLNRGIRDGSE
tara:strand:+ start:1680 stop:2570 length:891 start_codon:yes stop_codon:yes gene_type:complete